MALILGDNFSYMGAKPLDARLMYATIADMTAMADSTLYDGCLAYCVAADKTYQWKSTNTVDSTLGKWREFESGGGGGADNIVEGYFNSADNLFYEESTYTTAITGEAEKIYIDLPNNKTYRFDSTIFVRLDEEMFEDIQKDTLPIASTDELGNIYQYTGATTGDLVNGYFYKCVSDGQPTPAYSWEQVNVQPDNEGQMIQYATLPTAGSDVLGKIVQYIGADTASLEHGHFYECTTDGSTYDWTEIDVNDDENDIIQYTTLPTAASTIEGKIAQYIGTTTSNYINGYFYECIEDPDNAGSYIWTAKNVQAGGSGGGSLGKAITAAIDVGGIDAGDSFAVGTSYDSLWESLLSPALFPTLTDPTVSISGTGSKLLEMGSTLSATITVTFDRGSISPAYGTDGYRAGAATSYSLNGGTAQAGNTFTETVTSTNNTFTGTVAYGAGQQPLDSKGNPYSTAYSAGTKATSALKYEFVYALYANTSSDITVMTKQSLVSKSAKVKAFTFPATTAANPEAFDVPSAWTVSTVEVLNTLSGQWETATSQFTVTTTTHTDAGGNTVNYNRYTCNLGYALGSRQVRVKWN